MDIIFLGTGTSQGVPMIACDCPVCASSDPRNRRSRTSVHVVMDGLHVQVDVAPEFRLQCIENRISRVDMVLLTHGHADHIMGMDDLRRYCDLRRGEALPVFTTEEGAERVRAIYPYAISDRPTVPGYPAFKVLPMPAELELEQGRIFSTRLPHGRIEVLGLVFEERSSGRRLAYYTDCKAVGPEQRELARGADVIVLDGLRPEPHPTHMSIGEAVEVAADLKGGRTLLTHLTHAVDHETASAGLPAGVEFATDGLRIRL
ncbi:MAG: MBL fold metallo-hydrolase [Puniceicoccaceae bacterium]|nr:MAG: MBL fold metallo-hydrolase [Puniceicoccaceae bacterium]